MSGQNLETIVDMFDPAAYPNLRSEGYTPRSPKSVKYNCIAWAVGDNRRWWSPQIGYFWPPGAARINSIDAYIQALGTAGYVECVASECTNPPYESGVSRIALYILNGTPKHAARQITDNLWASKMGSGIDIEHTLRALEGPYYGWVQKILKR